MILDASALLFEVVPPLPGAVDLTRIQGVMRRIAADERLEAPAFIATELGHVIHRKHRTRLGGSRADRTAMLRNLLSRVEQVALDPPAWQEAGRLCEDAGMTFYDATYLATALFRGSALVSADNGVVEHARAAGLRAFLLPRDLADLERAYPDPESP